MKNSDTQELALVLVPDFNVHRFQNLLNQFDLKRFRVEFIKTKEELYAKFNSEANVTLLLSFGTSIIVPEAYLNKPGLLAINIHAASPEFPGRDPHHFAVYDSAKVYGATMHYMTKKVDDGPIIDIELFTIDHDYSPMQLLAKANECGWILLERLFKWLTNGKEIPLSEHKWNGKKRTRQDFLNLCKIEADITKQELKMRIKAFNTDQFNNLYTEIHGIKFYFHN